MASALFATTDKKLLEQDSLFWLNTLEHLLDLYKTSRVDNEADRGLRAYHASRIAGHCYAMVAHFSDCVSTLVGEDDDSEDLPACLDAAERMYTAADKHHNKMNGLAEKQQS